jgi:hypothetical protein
MSHHFHHFLNKEAMGHAVNARQQLAYIEKAPF